MDGTALVSVRVVSITIHYITGTEAEYYHRNKQVKD